MARGWATTLVALFARLLCGREILATMLVGDEKENAEFEAREIKIVVRARARLSNRGAASAAVEGTRNSSASSLVGLIYATSSDRPRAKLILLHEKMALLFNLTGFENETTAVVRNPAEASSSRSPVVSTNQPLLAKEIVENELGAACDTRDVAVFAGDLSTFAGIARSLALAVSEHAFSGMEKIANTEQEGADLLSIFKALVGRPSALREANVGYVSQIRSCRKKDLWND